MPSGLRRFQQSRQLHFITFSCYRRQAKLASPSARSVFENSLEKTRRDYGFGVQAYIGASIRAKRPSGTPVKITKPFPMLVLSLCLLICGCSTKVPEERVFGAYVASYPFGKEQLTFNQGGDFTQIVAIDGQAPVTVRGRWRFDAVRSNVYLYGSLLVVDGFGHLRPDWRTIFPGMIGPLSVERLWFRVVLNSGSVYPYQKQ